MTDLLPITLLYVEYETGLRGAVSTFLEMYCRTVQTAADGVEALGKIASQRPDIVVTDIRMPRLDGLELAARLKREHPDLPVIITTAFTEVDYLLKAIELGVSGFVRKPLDYEQLLAAIRKHAESVVQRRRIETLHHRIEDLLLERLGGSEALRLVAEQASRAAANNYGVMIEGEAGSGKSYLAGLIHGAGRPPRTSLIVVNGAGETVEQLEIEIFGRRGKELGKLSVAGAGTLLLQQVDLLPVSIQEHLATAIGEGRFFRSGVPEPYPLEARVMATLRGDAATAHREGRLVEALYYNLTEQVIAVPPLRTLPDDIPRMADRFLRVAAEDLHRPSPLLTRDALKVITGYPWPGNIRQLRNVMRRAAISAADRIDAAFLGTLLPLAEPETQPPGMDCPSSLLFDDVEQWVIREALFRSGGWRMRAAELVGMEYKRFKRKLDKYGLAGR